MRLYIFKSERLGLCWAVMAVDEKDADNRLTDFAGIINDFGLIQILDKPGQAILYKPD